MAHMYHWCTVHQWQHGYGTSNLFGSTMGHVCLAHIGGAQTPWAHHPVQCNCHDGKSELGCQTFNNRVPYAALLPLKSIKQAQGP